MNRSDSDCTRNSFNYRFQGTSAASRLGESSLAGMNRDQSTPSDSHHEDVSNKNDKQAMVPLHEDFVPGPNDVICGRGKKCYAHTGNERFRQIVQSYLDRYQAAASRPEKSEILSAIVSQVRESSPDGGFVKEANSRWFEVGDFLAREKTSQAFRDALAEHYRSSKKSKHEKRRQRTQAKALIEKQGSMLPPLGTGTGLAGAASLMDNQQAMYPSPLVSRQQLTVLREEPPQTRAFSFSGLTQEPPGRGREVRSRAMSLSSGGGHLRDLSDGDLPHGGGGSNLGDLFQRPDSAPGRYLDRLGASSVDDMTEIGLRQAHRLLSEGHESWPQPQRAQSSRNLYNQPSPLFAAQPQFHPVRAEDVAAHRAFPNSDAIMTAVDNVRMHGEPTQMTRWSNNMTVPGADAPQPQRDTLQIPTSFAPDPPSNSYALGRGVASSVGMIPPRQPTATQPATGIHHRTDSTASATVIVAQLASALHQDSMTHQDDENPFEPIPLGGRSKKKAKRG